MLHSHITTLFPLNSGHYLGTDMSILGILQGRLDNVIQKTGMTVNPCGHLSEEPLWLQRAMHHFTDQTLFIYLFFYCTV